MLLFVFLGFVAIIALMVYQHYLIFDRIDILQNDVNSSGKINTTDFNTFHIAGIIAILAIALVFWKERQ